MTQNDKMCFVHSRSISLLAAGEPHPQ